MEPRVSLVWNLSGNGKTVLRLGYGMFRDRLPQLPIGFEFLLGGQGLQSGTSPPPRRVASVVGFPSASIAVIQFLNGEIRPTDPQLAVIDERSSRTPVAQNLTVSVQSQLRSNTMVEASYAYSRGNRLLTSTDINLFPPALINGRPDFKNTFLQSGFAQIYRFETVGNSRYHAGSLQTTWRVRTLNIYGSYTYSRTIDDVMSGSFEATAQNVRDRASERAISDLNVGQRLAVSAFWDAPKPSGLKPSHFLRFLGALYVSNGFSFQSGRYFNVVTGSDSNRDGNPLTDRPLGVGRNTFLGQSFAELNTAIGGRIKRETRSLSFAVSFFNALNRVNFDRFNTVLGADQLGALDPRIASGRRELSGYDYRTPLAPNGFGLATRALNPRRIQLEARADVLTRRTWFQRMLRVPGLHENEDVVAHRVDNALVIETVADEERTLRKALAAISG